LLDFYTNYLSLYIVYPLTVHSKTPTKSADNQGSKEASCNGSTMYEVTFSNMVFNFLNCFLCLLNIYVPM